MWGGKGLNLRHGGLWKSLEGKIKTSWDTPADPLMEKMEMLQSNLLVWAEQIRKSGERLKKRLKKNLEMLLEEESNDDVLAKIIDTKVHLNLEMTKMKGIGSKVQEQTGLKLGIRIQVSFISMLRLVEKETIFRSLI